MDTVIGQQCTDDHSSSDNTHCSQGTATQTEWVKVRDVSDVCLVLQTHTRARTRTHTRRWLKQMCGCVNKLSLISLFLFTHHFFPVSVLRSLCVWERRKMNRGERYWGRVLEQRREQRSYDWRRTASRTAWSKAASAWPFGCGSSATLISIQIKVDWSVGPSLLVAQC